MASPKAFTVTETALSSVFIMLRGISSTWGIQSIRNCPGLALAQSLSVSVKVLTIGLSGFTLKMGVVLRVLSSVRNADNLLHAFVTFLSQIGAYSAVYSLENVWVFQCDGGTYLNG